MPHLPDNHWRTLVGLARFAGLRVPSETHALTWADIDFDQSRMTFRASKTSSTRTVPIQQRLMAIPLASTDRQSAARGLDISVPLMGPAGFEPATERL